MTGHANVMGLDPYDSGNDNDLHHMSTVIANKPAGTKNKVNVTSVSNIHAASNSNSLAEVNPNFSFGIDWSQANSSHVHHGKTYIYNNCSNITVHNDDKKSTKIPHQRLQIISSEEESPE